MKGKGITITKDTINNYTSKKKIITDDNKNQITRKSVTVLDKTLIMFTFATVETKRNLGPIAQCLVELLLGTKQNKRSYVHVYRS